MQNKSGERVAITAEVDREGRDTDDTLVVSEILSNWTVAVYKTQFPDC